MQLAIFVEHAPVPIAMFDRQMHYLHVSRRWKQEMHLGEGDLRGLSLYSVVPNIPERWKAVHRRCLAGEVVRCEEDCFDLMDGTTLWLRWECRPWFEDGGRVGGIIIYAEEITEEKQNATTLQQRELLVRLATDNASVGLVMLDSERRYVFANAVYPNILGLPWTAKELIGKRPAEVLPEVYASEIAPRLDRAFAGERLTYELARPLDKEFKAYYVVIYDPISNESGAVEGVIVTIFDISEQKRLEEQRLKLEEHLRQAQKLESLGVLAGGIAHDFNNVLTSILGYADLALLELPPHSSARPFIAEAVNGARKAADLTRQMLAYSGKGKFLVEALSLNDLIEDMIHLLQVSISKKCVLKLKLFPKLPSIEADAVQIRQVIMNLIINASDAIGDRSGVISISTGIMHCDRKYLSESYLDENLPEGNYVFLEVADTGCGMSDETRMRIFDPFFTTKTTGRGLGLAAAIGIVRGHRGALKVYSELDKGTTFKVALPATDIEAQVGPKADSGAVNWRGSGTVLLVDDEEAVRGLVRCMLERMGFTVLTACDGREAVEEFRRSTDNIRLVLLDMTMPHLDGSETFRELRRISGNVKTILTSGYNEQSAISQFAGKGLAGFIQKPFQYEELQAVVRKALGQQP